VIKALGSDVAAPSIVRRLAKPLPGSDFSNRIIHTELAEAIDDVRIALSYVDQIDNAELPLVVRRCFADALAKSHANIPLEVYTQLTKHSDAQIRADAFEALGRFRFRHTEEVIGQALRELQATPADGPGRPDLIQHAIVRALVAQGRLTVLLRDEYRPHFLYHFAHRTIVEAMGRQNIAELAPFVMEFVPKDKRTRLVASIALALGEVGELEFARHLRDEALVEEREPYTERDLITGCHRLPAPEALEWLEIAWQASKSTTENTHGLMESEYVEALGRIGSVEAQAILMHRIERPTGSSEVFHDLRALRDLATVDLEEWLLSLLDSSHLQRSNVRCWVISILRRVGTAQSIATLLPLLQGSLPDVRQAAFRAIRDIHARRDEVWLGN
jgi:HEAT repeat protein